MREKRKNNRRELRLSRKSRKVSFMLALFMLASVAYIVPSGSVDSSDSVFTGSNGLGNIVYADDTTEETTADSDEGSDTYNADKKKGLLEADLGRVEFWEWNKVTKKNFTKYMTDNKFHASMLFYYDTYNNQNRSTWSQSEPKGFISTYDDKQHITRGINDENWVQYWDKYTTDRGIWDAYAKTNFASWTMKAQVSGKSWNFWHGYAEEESKQIKMDSQGKQLNGTGYYKQDRFFTTSGGSMGVPYIKSIRSGTDIMDKLKGMKQSQWCSEVSIYLQRGTDAKGTTNAELDIGTQSTDSYIECWKGLEGKQPGIQVWKGTDPKGSDKFGNKHGQSRAFTMHPAAGDENSDMWVAKCLIGMDHDDLDYAKCWDNDQEDADDTAPTLGVTQTGLLTAYDAKRIYGYGGGSQDCDAFYTGTTLWWGAWNIFWPETPGVYSVFKWYVGTNHLFTSINDQTFTDGQLKTFTAGDFYSAKEGQAPEKTEGIIIPKGNTLTIDGGTVAVDCNIINNGTIDIKNGGTLIIKSNGCISPFTEEAEGVIKNQGGTIIIMEGGKCFCLNNKYTGTDAPLTLSAGGTLINYGTLVLSNAVLTNGSKIENRKDALLMSGYNRNDDYALLANASIDKKNAKIEYIQEVDTKLDFSKYTVSITGGTFSSTELYQYQFTIGCPNGETVCIPVSMLAGKEWHRRRLENYNYTNDEVYEFLEGYGYFSYYDIGVSAGIKATGGNYCTLVNEKTATLKHTLSTGRDTIDEHSITIVTPEY